MISKIFLLLTLLVSNIYAQEGWNEWAWEKDQIPYSRFPTNYVEMYVQYDAATNIIAMYPMSPDITVSDLGGGQWQEEPVLVRAQDMRALDCWYSLKERFQKLGVYSRNAKSNIDLMPFPISFYRSDIENIDALKGLIFELAGTINADADPYQNGGLDEEGENAFFTSGCWYPMFVNPSMLTSPKDYLGIALETDQSQGRLNEEGNAYEYPSRYATSGIAVSPWAAQISVSNILTRASLPVYWTKETTQLNQSLHPDAILSRLDPYTVEYLDVFGCFDSAYCLYPPSGNPLPVNPSYPTTMPSFVWSYDSAFRPTDAYIYARTSWVNTTYWYQEPSFQTNRYPIGAYEWDRIRSAIRLFSVVAVPRIRDEVGDKVKIVWTRNPISGTWTITDRVYQHRGDPNPEEYIYYQSFTYTNHGMTIESPQFSTMDGPPSGFVGWNTEALNLYYDKQEATAYWESYTASRHCWVYDGIGLTYSDRSAYSTPPRIYTRADDSKVSITTTSIVDRPKYDNLPSGVVAWFVKPKQNFDIIKESSLCQSNALDEHGVPIIYAAPVVTYSTNYFLSVTNYVYSLTAYTDPVSSYDVVYYSEPCKEYIGCERGDPSVRSKFYETIRQSVAMHKSILLYAVRDVSDEFAYK